MKIKKAVTIANRKLMTRNSEFKGSGGTNNPAEVTKAEIRSKMVGSPFFMPFKKLNDSGIIRQFQLPVYLKEREVKLNS